jgi:8-oxo-dGTP pyrophosphatase MutT (NUDIX family)
MLENWLKNATTIEKQAKSPLAAVLVPIFEKNGYPCLLLTKRSSNLNSHAGQISFPGGKIDETDESIISTSIRETYEELQIPSSKIIVLGEGKGFWTPYIQSVATVFAVIDTPFEYTKSEMEIEEVIEVPILDLTNSENHEHKPVHLLNDPDHKSHYFYWNEYVIWGATAGVIHDVLTELRLMK